MLLDMNTCDKMSQIPSETLSMISKRIFNITKLVTLRLGINDNESEQIPFCTDSDINEFESLTSCLDKLEDVLTVPDDKPFQVLWITRF